MTDEIVPEGEGTPKPDKSGAGEVTRHDSIPETYFDGETKSYKFEDIGKALTEGEQIRAAQAERAAQIPGKPEDYKFDLPKDFQLPVGFKYQADPNDPLVAAFREFAVTNKLTQPEVSSLVGLYAKHQADGITGQQAFEAEQTKALGANAGQRRKAASDWIKGSTTPERAKVLMTLLPYAAGVEALEDIIAKSGINPRGDSGAGVEGNAKTAELKEQVGKPGGARNILNAAHTA